MMDLQMIKAIVAALRQEPMEAGIYREEGFAPRRQHGSLIDMLRGQKRGVEYGRYQAIQDAIGEKPVSYEEYMRE